MYAFSTENWRRPPEEVRYLMGFNESLLMRRRDELNDKGVRIRFAGRRDWRVPKRVLRRMDESIELTKHNRRCTLTMAFNYGGRAEIVDAVRDLVAEGVKPEKVTEKAIRSPSLLPRPARPRPGHPHLGRAPDLQLPALAARLQRAGLHRGPLARLPPLRPVRRGAGLPAPPAPLRRRHLMRPGPRPRRRRWRVDRDRLGPRLPRLRRRRGGLARRASRGRPVRRHPARAPRHGRRRQPGQRPAGRTSGPAVQPTRSRAAAPRCGGDARADSPTPGPTAPTAPAGRGSRAGPMTQFRDRGVVLRTIRLGEADRIVTLMTEHHGKVRAVAKGVRRTTSKFGSRLEPLSHVALLGWQGRGDLDTINQVEVIDTFRPVREDLDRMSAALSMLEVVDQVGQERHANPRLYEMAVAGPRPPWPSRTRPWWPRPSSSRCSPSRGRPRSSTAASRAARTTTPSWWPSTSWRAGCCAGPAVGAGRCSADGLDAAAPDPRRRPVRGAGRAPLGRHRRGDRARHRGHGGPSRPSAPVGPGRPGLLSAAGRARVTAAAPSSSGSDATSAWPTTPPCVAAADEARAVGRPLARPVRRRGRAPRLRRAQPPGLPGPDPGRPRRRPRRAVWSCAGADPRWSCPRWPPRRAPDGATPPGTARPTAAAATPGWPRPWRPPAGRWCAPARPTRCRPGGCVTGGGAPYRVFTPFRRAWAAHGWPPPRRAAPTGVRWAGRPELALDDLDPDPVDGGARRCRAAGEAAAADLLERLPRRAGRRLRRGPGPARPAPARHGCRPTCASAPSTPARCWPDCRPGRRADVFRSELAWREFYADVLWHRPDSAWTSLSPVGDHLRWDTGPEADARFAAWAAGPDRVPAGRRRHAPAGRRGVDAQPGPDADRLVPGQGPAPRLARGARLVHGPAHRRRPRLQQPRLAVGGRHRHGRGPLPPGLQSRAAGRALRPRRRLRAPATSPEHGTPAYPAPIVDHAVERREALDRLAGGQRRPRAAPGPASRPA